MCEGAHYPVSMNNIKIFQNEQFGQVRIAMNESNEPVFCLADVCQVLDLTPSKVAQRLDKDVLSKYPLETGKGQIYFIEKFLSKEKPFLRKEREDDTTGIKVKPGKIIGAYEGIFVDGYVTFGNLSKK